jgi:hypothetical protein
MISIVAGMETVLRPCVRLSTRHLLSKYLHVLLTPDRYCYGTVGARSHTSGPYYCPHILVVVYSLGRPSIDDDMVRFAMRICQDVILGNICTWSSTYSPRSSILSPCSSVLVDYQVEAASARISGPWELGSGNVFLTGSTDQHGECPTRRTSLQSMSSSGPNRYCFRQTQRRHAISDRRQVCALFESEASTREEKKRQIESFKHGY